MPTGSLSPPRPATLLVTCCFLSATTLSLAATARPWWEEGISCRDSKPLGSNHYQTSCISWHNMSRATWQLNSTSASSQCCKKREILSPSPDDPMTGSASLHTLSSPETLEETHFRLLTKLRPHSPTLDSLGSPLSIRLPDQEHDLHLLRLPLVPRICARR